MGKRLKDDKLPKGVTINPKSKKLKYRARFVTFDGKRVDRSFETVKEASAWLLEVKYDDSRTIPVINHKTTVNEWFNQWIQLKDKQRRENTVRNYINRYLFNIKPVIGKMPIADVKPIHCQKVLDEMKGDYANSTIEQTFICMRSMFYSAFVNDVIRKSPVSKKTIVIPEGDEEKEIDFFSIEEAKLFLAVAKDLQYYEQFAFLLTTGIRISELVGLKWKNVDLENKVIRIDEILEYRYQRRIDAEKSKDPTVRKDGWRWGPPKTKASIREVKLSDTAVSVLERIKDRPYLRDDTPEEFRDLVFLCKRTGLPVRSNTYDNAIRKRIDTMTAEINDNRKKEGLEPIEPHYLSCHDFRHTYATMYLESAKNGNNYAKVYKFLSKQLGHKSTRTTLDIYCSLTEGSVEDMVDGFEELMKQVF